MNNSEIFELRKKLEKILEVAEHDHIVPMEDCPYCTAADALAILHKRHYESISDAAGFFDEKVKPNLADKNFICPSWAIDFAERYAEYKVSAFYRLKLQLEMEDWDSVLKRVLNKADASID